MAAHPITARALRELLGDWRDASAAYSALAGRIQVLLLDGRLSSDVRLPAERELASALGLSRTTITAAYARLRDDGYARSRVGSGTTTTLPDSGGAPAPVGDGPIDFTMASLPATRVLDEIADDVVGDLRGRLGERGYEVVGDAGLREAIAARYTARGLPTTPDQILVTSGAQSAIALCARAFGERGDRMYTESPSYPNAFDALRAAGGRIVTSPVTVEDGWDVEALDAVFYRAAPTVAYMMPEFHNPTARSLTDEGREYLMRAASAAGTVILADETTAELAIDDVPPHPPLATLADSFGAQVVHIGSASKLLWAGLRIGWIRTTPHHVARLATARGATDQAAPIFEQLAVARLLGHADEIVAERRAQLRERREVLRTSIERLLPDWEFPPAIPGGLAAWIKLPAPRSSQLALAAHAHGVRLTAGPRFGVDGAFETYVRIPISSSPDDLRRGVEVLAELWPQLASAPRDDRAPLAPVA